MNELSIRKNIIKFSKLLNKTNLSPLRSGNISVRYKNGFLITPSGMKYENLKPKDIVFVNMKGEFNKQKNKPSSEWKFHKDIYKNKKKESNAIVHCHSKNALVLSCIRKKIPAFHYMVAVAGGIDIRCAKYATYGTSDLSKNITALKQRSACLIENHGQVSFSNNLSNAFELAQEVEYLAEQYLECLRVGKPKILSLSQMNKVLAKVKNYKQ